jgi:hypothetical protein
MIGEYQSRRRERRKGRPAETRSRAEFFSTPDRLQGQTGGINYTHTVAAFLLDIKLWHRQRQALVHHVEAFLQTLDCLQRIHEDSGNRAIGSSM